ncbi:hypothetical protein LNKW23_13780 [Paralimibaculum aggregatum]|uniref:DUF883 domain-containing protein n=1 Tax=Paralimibaculum aggregatum TaxID=3036245 RepID=A0ABQ6LPC9_9RHOB|nr:hypothetical protein [Limibaculum sp. NKW23]GMG82165.1 hypothetical protein LNKW23_13780 [Limibaculum sp. NKW23]
MATTRGRASEDKAEDGPGLEELKAQIEALRKDVEGLAEIARDAASAQGRRGAAAARDRVEELSESAREAYRAARDDLGQRGEAAIDETQEMIRRNPLAAIGIALAAGWLIGKLSSR